MKKTEITNKPIALPPDKILDKVKKEVKKKKVQIEILKKIIENDHH
jgi:hypothetical protein